MDLKGEYKIPAPREQVWAMIQDPEVLKACIPGCEELERISDNSFQAKVTTKVGPVKATFNGTVELKDLNEPESFTLTGEGKGGVAGFAKGGADINLAQDGDGTALSYTAEAQVGGKLAQLGSRLIGSTAKKLSDQFFSAFVEKASGGAAPDEDAAKSAAVPAADPANEAELLADEAKAPAQASDAATEAPSAAAAPTDDASATPPETSDETKHSHHAASDFIRQAEDAAEDAEQKLEEKAAGGFLGGPFVWGLLILAAIILYYMVAT